MYMKRYYRYLLWHFKYELSFWLREKAIELQQNLPVIVGISLTKDILAGKKVFRITEDGQFSWDGRQTLQGAETRESRGFKVRLIS